MDAEICKLHLAVDRFAVAMKAKLLEKAEQGWTGWRDPECSPGIRDRLKKAYDRFMQGDRSQGIDVANLAMFLTLMPEDDS